MKLPDQIQLEDATLISVAWENSNLVFNMHADAHDELYCHSYETRIVIGNATLSDELCELPAVVTDFELVFPGHSTYMILLNLPFSIVSDCNIAFTLASGDSIAAAGDSCAVELGKLLSSVLIVFDP